MPGVVGVIPARLASQRFPRKMLANDTGKPLVQHVYERAKQATALDRLVIATDAQEIADACAQFGAEAVMTSPEHPNGTSRLGEAADALGLADDVIVVNVQVLSSDGWDFDHKIWSGPWPFQEPQLEVPTHHISRLLIRPM